MIFRRVSLLRQRCKMGTNTGAWLMAEKVQEVHFKKVKRGICMLVTFMY